MKNNHSVLSKMRATADLQGIIEAKKGLYAPVLLFFLMLIGFPPAFAQIVTLACPTPSSLTFTKNSDRSYRVSAMVRIVQGSTPPFRLSATTPATKALVFNGAQYNKDREHHVYQYICRYEGTDQTNNNYSFSISNQPAFGLEYCYFPANEGRSQCVGGALYCQLKCDML